MSSFLAALLALLYVLCTTTSALETTSSDTSATTYEKPFMPMDNELLADLAKQASTSSEAKNIIGGVLACVTLLALVGGCCAYLVYKRYAKKRTAAAIEDAKAAASDSISEAKTLV
ncbi:hypothetical protein GGI20_004235 [Coemansia sp. BCRC 34301]|nr:hypothetical protein GGI20_004235 [Coemansia sp. BCRC 34301]